jgi:hypothetical protein
MAGSLVARILVDGPAGSGRKGPLIHARTAGEEGEKATKG